MITLDFSKKGTLTLCDFLYNSIKDQILCGNLKPGEKLPSKRTFAQHHGISIITVQNAYAQLISEGYIYSLEKRGYFISDIKPVNTEKKIKPSLKIKKTSSSKPTYIADLSGANENDIYKFPFSQWAKTMRNVLSNPSEKLLQKTDIFGVYELRNAIANYLNQFRNMQVVPEQIVIGAGTESLYSLVTVFLGTNKLYAIENPGYKKVKQIFELNGAQCIPVNVDSEGIDINILYKTNSQILHISPSHHFPTGIVTTVKRRQELLEWVKKTKGIILEDEYDSEFRFNGKPLEPLFNINSDSIIYINTFSKTLSPSFRISYMILPENMIESFSNKMGFYSCSVSSFEQYTLAKFIDEGHFEKHIFRMKNYYKSIRNEFLQEIKKSNLRQFCSVEEENSGLHFILKVKPQYNAAKVSKLLKEKNINLPLLKNFNLSSSEYNSNDFVVNYSGINKKQIPQIIKIMQECFASL